MRYILLLFSFCIANTTWGLSDGLKKQLVVGPRPGETGRYIVNVTKTDNQMGTKSEVEIKHCLFCDVDVAFVNTTMNRLHQEEECEKKHSGKSLIDNLTEYERKNKLVPFCKLGDVPGCGPPPNEENIQFCDPGYSNVQYSVYFSCLVANDNTGQSVSTIYCNEQLKWENVTNGNDGEIKPVYARTEEVAIDSKEIKTTYVSNDVTIAVEYTNARIEGPEIDKEEESPLHVDGTMQIVVVALAVVLAVLAVIIGSLLVRHLWKRHKTYTRGIVSSHPHSSTISPPSSSSSPQAQSSEESGDGCRSGENASLLNTTVTSFTSDGCCQTDVEVGNSLLDTDDVTIDMTSYQDTNLRQQPIGEEEGTGLFTCQNDIKSNISQNTTLPSTNISIPVQESFKKQVPKFKSCPGVIHTYQDANENNIEPNQASNGLKTKTHEESVSESSRAQATARNDEIDKEFTPNIVSLREDPVGKMCQPRYGDSLEENSHNTEPKRLVSLERHRSSMENEESFEIDSGINMNIGPFGFKMETLK
ncbi:hypothetical protein ACF0H5_010073 [Mactra antiquata]